MMLQVFQTSRFKKDIKLAKKRGKDLDKLKRVVTQLMQDQPLAAKYRDHALTGNWLGSRDCHIEPDWLLIYRIDGNDLYLERSGSHSDLFK